MIDPNTETVVALSEAAKYPPLRVNGKSPNRTTVWRWAKAGAKAAAGGRVSLETIKMPRGPVTSLQAIDRFIAAIRGGPVAGSPVRVANTSAMKDRLRNKGLLD